MGGQWYDSGPVALTPATRPQLETALSFVPDLLHDYPRVMVVVHSRDRLSSASYQAGWLAEHIEGTGAELHVVHEDVSGHVCAPLPTPAEGSVRR
ncbi:hypothetical protein GCM10027168_16270 [Streptomyces capparidis]